MEDNKAEVELSEAELDAIFGGQKTAGVCRCEGRTGCICSNDARCSRVCVA